MYKRQVYRLNESNRTKNNQSESIYNETIRNESVDLGILSRGVAFYASPGELFSIPGFGGVYIAGDPEINPQLADFTTTADVIVLSQKRTT